MGFDCIKPDYWLSIYFPSFRPMEVWYEIHMKSVQLVPLEKVFEIVEL